MCRYSGVTGGVGGLIAGLLVEKGATVVTVGSGPVVIPA